MPIRADAVGTELDASETEVSARRLLAYAAAVGETAARFFDDAREGGIVGVPAFCTSLEWPVVRARRGRNAFGLADAELLRGVHASQDSHFARAIRPGDRLRTEGLVASITASRAGARVVTRLHTTVAGTNEPVVTSWYTSIFRGVEVIGEVASAAEPDALPAAEVEAGDDAERIEIPVAREMPHLYTEAADIWNPIHTERRVALAAGLPDIVLHGTATWALAAREILARRAGGDPARLRRLHGRFSGLVVPGTTVTLRLGPASGAVVPFDVLAADGATAVRRGVAELA